MQDGPGEDRQQRHRTPEQHREQVEQDGAEQDRGVADEAQALQHAVQIGALGRGVVAVRPIRARSGGVGRLRRVHRHHQAGGHDARTARQQIHERRGHAVEQAAQRRPTDLTGLGGDGAQRHGALEELGGHEGGRQRAGGRRPQRHRGAGGGGEREIRRQRGVAGSADQGQPDADARSHQQRPGEDEAARRAIGELTCGEREHEHRHELRQPDPPEVQRGPVLGVDLPADRHLEHLQAEPHAERGQPPQPEVPDLQSWADTSHGSRA